MASHDTAMPERAMVLAAGLGQRMRSLTGERPKPLVEVEGRALIDHVLDRLAAAGISTAVVNAHYLADRLEAHLAGRKEPRVVISDERAQLLETGGGIKKALPQFGDTPFLLVNSDSLWIEPASNLARLAQAFDAARMDALLLLAAKEETIGYDGRGDYEMAPDARLRRGGPGGAPFVYAGVAILSPTLFADAPDGAFALSLLFNRAEARDRLFGLTLQGTFLHVGTPEAIPLAEQAIRRAAG